MLLIVRLGLGLRVSARHGGGCGMFVSDQGRCILYVQYQLSHLIRREKCAGINASFAAAAGSLEGDKLRSHGTLRSVVHELH